MADSDADNSSTTSRRAIAKEWTFVNERGEVESDDNCDTCSSSSDDVMTRFHGNTEHQSIDGSVSVTENVELETLSQLTTLVAGELAENSDANLTLSLHTSANVMQDVTVTNLTHSHEVEQQDVEIDITQCMDNNTDIQNQLDFADNEVTASGAQLDSDDNYFDNTEDQHASTNYPLDVCSMYLNVLELETNNLQNMACDDESLSYGSSVELLDMTDEGSDTTSLVLIHNHNDDSLHGISNVYENGDHRSDEAAVELVKTVDDGHCDLSNVGLSSNVAEASISHSDCEVVRMQLSDGLAVSDDNDATQASRDTTSDGNDVRMQSTDDVTPVVDSCGTEMAVAVSTSVVEAVDEQLKIDTIVEVYKEPTGWTADDTGDCCDAVDAAMDSNCHLSANGSFSRENQPVQPANIELDESMLAAASDVVNVETSADGIDDTASNASVNAPSSIRNASVHSSSFSQLDDANSDRDEDDAEALAVDNVDDRCESDISGVAADDTDLSSISNIGDLPVLDDRDLVRLYRHQPNHSFDALLTFITVLAVCFGLGIGIGHYFGSTRMSTVHEQQASRLKSLQDSHFNCLSQLENVEDKLRSVTDMEKKLVAVTSVWRKKYEELVIERAELEHQLSDLQRTSKESTTTIGNYQQKLSDTQDALEFLIKDVDRLNIDLASTNQSLRLSHAEVETWKYQFAAAELKREHLANRLESSIAEAEKYRWMLEDERKNAKRMEMEKVSATVISDMMKDELFELKNKLNQLMLENTELKAVILNLRYTEHPGNTAAGSTAAQLAHLMVVPGVTASKNLPPMTFVAGPDSHIGHNEGLPSSVTDKEYRQDSYAVDQDASDHGIINSNQSEDGNKPSIDVSEQLSMQFVRLWSLLSGIDAELSAMLSANIDSPQPVFVTLLRYVLSLAANSSEQDINNRMAVYSDSLRQVADCVEVLTNLSDTSSSSRRGLAMMMTSTWDQLMVVHSNNEAEAATQTSCTPNDEALQALAACRQQFVDTVTRSQLKDGADDPAKPNTAAVEGVHDIFKRYMNKTMETVKRLSHTIQSTLNQVKTIPDDLFADNKTAQKMSRKLTATVKKLNKKFKAGWKQIADNLAFVRKKWFGYSSSQDRTCRRGGVHKKFDPKKSADTHHKRTGDKAKAQNRRKLPPPPLPLTDKFVESERQFECKRDHKQTESVQHAKQFTATQKDNDGYSSAGAQPDGFFEGNQREWRRMHDRHRLQKLRGHIARLTEEMFLAMDDDDIEDTYDDVKELDDEVPDHRDVSNELRAWLTCQRRWWKTRLHRKHRADDLVKGCGQQLMHWQLRVLCKDDKTAGQDDSSAAWMLQQQHHHLCKSVLMMSPSAGEETIDTGSDHSLSKDRSQSVASEISNSRIHDSTADTEQQQNEQDSSELPSYVDDSEKFESQNKTWDYHIEEQHDGDTAWYFRRVQDREDHHQASPHWYFDRVEDRQYSRTDANWYVRALHRRAVTGATIDINDDDEDVNHHGQK
jgi:hypothetical protein